MQASTDPTQTLATLQSGAGQVSWGGPMRLLHAFDANPASNLVSFCEVVSHDPFYLIGRTCNDHFRMQDLAGRRLAVVSEVPTPWYCLQYDLKLAGVDVASINVAPMRTMAANAALLRAGELDVIQVFEPFAQQLTADGAGYRWYTAASRGPATYTTLNTTREFMQREPQTVLAMTRAIYRMQRWIATHTGEEFADLVGSYFADLQRPTLVASLARYKANGLWNTTPVQLRAGVEWLREAMIACGAIKARPAFDDLSDMRFAEQVVNEGIQ
jgi:NitT/TauT family transport system substrate-binding protein